MVLGRTSLRAAEVARRKPPSASAHVRPERLSLGRNRSIRCLGLNRSTSSLGTRPNNNYSRRFSIRPEDPEVTAMMMVIRQCGEPDLTGMQISGQATPSETEWEFGS